MTIIISTLADNETHLGLECWDRIVFFVSL